MKRVYVKDLSFESPATPNIFAGDHFEDRRHKADINIRVSHIKMENDEHEVAVRITFHATDADNHTICLVEVEQAGIFRTKDVADNDLEQYLKVHCPRAVYAFARQTVYTVVTTGGFPGLLLADFDFEAMQQMT
jgi:preprotein translocase subunit SecB